VSVSTSSFLCFYCVEMSGSASPIAIF
jgi:hypothetical protein